MRSIDVLNGVVVAGSVCLLAGLVDAVVRAVA